MWFQNVFSNVFLLIKHKMAYFIVIRLFYEVPIKFFLDSEIWNLAYLDTFQNWFNRKKDEIFQTSTTRNSKTAWLFYKKFQSKVFTFCKKAHAMWKKYCAILLVFGSCTQNFMSLWWFCAEKWLVKVEHVLGGVHRVHCTQNGIVHWLTQPHTLPKLGTVHS